MPQTGSQLGNVGSITKALLDALDQIEQYVAASQIGPDGNPSSTAIYMHMPMGYPIDPKDFANAYTTAGGDSSASFSNDGAFSAPAASASSSAPASAPAGSLCPPPAQPQAQAQNQESILAAFNTSQLVDHMLEVTKNGVAVAWPDRDVSVEFFTVVQGMQPFDQAAPAQAVLDKIAAAQNLLFIKDANGNFIGYSPLYAAFRRNQTAWATAVSQQAAAYAQAMADPVAGQEWPITSKTYATAVTQALNDFNSMGRAQVQHALDTIAAEGESAVTAIAALARQLYDTFQVQLAGAASSGVSWSYISPSSWWDYTDTSFGVQTITGSSTAHDQKTASGQSAFSSNWQQAQSSSTSGSAGFNCVLYSGSGSASHASTSNAFKNNADQFSWSTHTDTSSSATVSLEYFVATIERPWYLGDIFNIKGWYLVGQRANSISDGTLDNQLTDKNTTAILPMIPKAFLVIRNVSITCNDWGDAGTALNSAAQASQGSNQASQNSAAIKAGYLFASGSVQHSDQQSSGAFGTSAVSSGITFNSDGSKGGTLKLLGSQIAGWIGQIQPPAPLMDDPTLPKPKTDAAAAITAPAQG